MAPSPPSSGSITPTNQHSSHTSSYPAHTESSTSSTAAQQGYQEDEEESDDEELLAMNTGNGSRSGGSGNGRPLAEDTGLTPSRSPYKLSTSEKARAIANRIIFSKWYLLFYLAMMALSTVTVIMSLIEGACASNTWHILEIIVNGAMVLEVGTRWVGFGKQYPLTPLNILDLVLTAFCIITLLVVFLNPCGSRDEEILDTILLVVRNGVQLFRLFAILRRSGHSLMHPPKPIDLSQARAAAYDLDLNLEDDEALAEHHLNYNPLAMNSRNGGGGGGGVGSGLGGVGGRTYFDAADELENGNSNSNRASPQPQAPQRKGVFGNGKGQVGYEAGRDNLEEDDEAQWDRLG